MKKTVLFSVLALTTTAFADAEGEMIAAAPSSGQQSQKQQQQPMLNVVTLTSARPDSDNGWYLFADALYWHADVGNTDWGWIYKPNANDVLNNRGTLHHLDFKWDWGFKVGLGVNMDHDLWDSNLYYTWFQTKNSNAMGIADISNIGNISLPSLTRVTSARHNWSIHFSMFDWELGRWYYVSKNMFLRPHVGVKGGWINQERRLHGAQVPQNSHNVMVTPHITAHFKNDFWGVGPSGGINTMWDLGHAGKAMDHRFCLFGDFAGALMYGHFENEYAYQIKDENGNPMSSLKLSNLDRNLAVPMLQAILGLTWDTPFNRGRSHFMMKLGYEFQYWFRQNQYLLSEIDDVPASKYSRYSDDLALQGITTELRFDF